MEEKNFSAEDSLLLIQNMIHKTKNTVAGDSFYFLLWGWLVFIACILQFVLKVIFKSPYHPTVWFLMLVGMVVSAYHGMKEDKTRKVKTYVDEMLDYLWLSIFFSYILFLFIFSRMGWEHCYSFYMLLYAIGTFVTGRLLKFPPLVWGAIGSWLLAIISTFISFDLNILLCALAIMVSYIIPGYLLKIKYKEQH
jgi:hypothetical protein